MADNRIGREEIESHSSALTNKRIDNLLTVVDSASIIAQSAVPPSRYHAIEYHSALMAFYLETSSAYTQQKMKGLKETIETCIKKGQRYNFQMKYGKDLSQFLIELSIQNSMTLQHAMHTALQNLKYFFRFGQHDPRGLKETLKLFETGGEQQNVEQQIPKQIGTIQDEAEKES